MTDRIMARIALTAAAAECLIRAGQSGSGGVAVIRSLPGTVREVGVLAMEYLDLHRARLTGGVPRTMPILMIEVTRHCNLRCAYCGYPEHYPDMGDELSTDEIKSILGECLELKTRIVSFGGGEPFLRPDMLELIAFSRSLGLQVHIDTNGTRVDSAAIDAIADGTDVAFIFSLDHPEASVNDSVRGRGSYAGVTLAARLLRASRPHISVGINCVVGSHNIDRLGDMVELAVSLGVNGVKFLPLHQNQAHRWRYGAQAQIPLDPGDPAQVQSAVKAACRMARARGLHTNSARFVELAGTFPATPRKWACWAGYIFGNIDPYGNLFPCYEIMDVRVNVRNGGLVAAWSSHAMSELRTRVRKCSQACLAAGSTEASLRMSPAEVIKDPGQLVRDFRFFFGNRG